MNCSKTSLLKRVFCFALALILCAGAFLIAPTEASAAAEGTMMSNAVDAQFGQTYAKYWNKDNDHLNHYVKITVPEQGVATITATKPYDSEGEYGQLSFTLYDQFGEPVWGNDTWTVVKDAKGEYRFKVGLAAGTYYLTIKPKFSVYSGVIQTYYGVSFVSNAYCEIEPNDSGYAATKVELGQKYAGWYGQDMSYYEDSDYFKVSVLADHTYRIVWYDFAALKNTSTIVRFLMPDGKNNAISYNMERYVNDEGLNYVDITVAQSGTAYIYLNNCSGAQFEYGFVITDVTCQINGHTFSEWATTKKATCTKDGEQIRTCAECGLEEKQVIAKGHSYKAATCTKPKTCKNCGATSGKKLGHTYTNDCDTICNRCSAKRSITHTYKTTTTKATLSKNGSIVKKCTVCDRVASKTTIKSVKTVKLSATSYVYNGKVKTPTVTVKDSAGKTLKEGTDYTVTYASGRKNAGTYKVTIKFKGNYSGTKELTFKILPAAKITTQPKTQKVEAGDKIKFTVKASGTGLKYQWQVSTNGKTWKNCSSDAKKATFSFTGKTSHDGNYYRCKVTDSAGNVVYTSKVRAYVLGIEEQPVKKTVTKGKTAKFEVEATGHSLKYQWQYSTDGGKTWKNITSTASAKKATFKFTAKTSHNGNYYRCKITDSAKNVIYTSKIKLTVKK